jgi:hypothetical protein
METDTTPADVVVEPGVREAGVYWGTGGTVS